MSAAADGERRRDHDEPGDRTPQQWCPDERPYAADSAENRSYSIGAVVHVAAAGAKGVLFSHGSRLGMYVKDNRLCYVYNFIGMHEQRIVLLAGSFDKTGE